MILQALTRYYENLLARGSAQRPGWAKAKVSYALELDDQGRWHSCSTCSKRSKRGKRRSWPLSFWTCPPR